MKESTGWTAPDGVRVAVVPMNGAHRVMADALGCAIPPDATHAFLVTRHGAIIERGYYPTVESLAEVVDLAALQPA